MSLRPPGKRQQKNETKQNTLLGRRAVSANRPQGPRPAAASAEVPLHVEFAQKYTHTHADAHRMNITARQASSLSGRTGSGCRRGCYLGQCFTFKADHSW